MSSVTERLNEARCKYQLHIDRMDGVVQPDMFDTQNFLVNQALDAWTHVVHIGIKSEVLKRASRAGSKEAAKLLELGRKKRRIWKHFAEMAGCNHWLLIHEACANDLLPKEVVKKAQQIPVMRIYCTPIN